MVHIYVVCRVVCHEVVMCGLHVFYLRRFTFDCEKISDLVSSLLWMGLALIKARAINSKHRSCDETMHFRCWVPFWFCTIICNHAPKERVHYVFCHQTKACAAGTARQIFVAFVNHILHERYIYTFVSIKDILIVRWGIKMAPMAPDPSSLIGRMTCVYY